MTIKGKDPKWERKKKCIEKLQTTFNLCLLDERHSSPEPQSFYGLEPGHEKYILSSLPVPICESSQEICRSIPLKKDNLQIPCLGTDSLKDPEFCRVL